jgi:hypothetical protein
MLSLRAILSRPVALRSLRVPMKRIILFVGGLGIIFLASAVQAFGTNWLGQACRNPACFHLEWLAVGIGLSTAAYIAWKVRGRRS